MKKIARVFLSIFVCFALSATSFAHSGRTDSNGGHKDNNNVSGLGSYHYHHGESAHLHPNGVCPYGYGAITQSTSTTKSQTQATNKTSVTDIKAYINSNFIPSLNYKSSTYIIAEDLSSYGFDVVWDGTDRTLKIKANAEKEMKSISSANSSTTYTIESTDIKTYIYNPETQTYDLISSYNTGGNTIIKFSDVGEASWDQATRSTSITL